MQLYSTGEAARKLRVTRDSLHAALRANAPDAANRIGSRRVFTEKEIEALGEWFDHRQQKRNGLLPREN